MVLKEKLGLYVTSLYLHAVFKRTFNIIAVDVHGDSYIL